jgi:hypothetical protein
VKRNEINKNLSIATAKIAPIAQSTSLNHASKQKALHNLIKQREELVKKISRASEKVLKLEVEKRKISNDKAALQCQLTMLDEQTNALNK